MNKTELKKNRLDLEYKFESQKAIMFLTFGTITLLGFLTAELLQKALDTLSLEDKILLEARYGLFPYKKPMTLRELAPLFKITKGGVSAKEIVLLKKLKENYTIY